MIMIVGFSPMLKFERIANASSMVNILNAKAASSSAMSSSVLIGISRMPPKLVKWVVTQLTPEPSAATTVDTPSVLQTPRSSSQNLQGTWMEQLAST